MNNLKALMEKRDELQQKMDSLVSKADQETRAMAEEEVAEFDAAEKEIRAIDETIARDERARSTEKKTIPTATEEGAAVEEKEFADYVMGKITEMRAGEQNMTMSNNGAIHSYHYCQSYYQGRKRSRPILARATIYNVKGTLKVPGMGEGEHHSRHRGRLPDGIHRDYRRFR